MVGARRSSILCQVNNIALGAVDCYGLRPLGPASIGLPGPAPTCSTSRLNNPGARSARPANPSRHAQRTECPKGTRKKERSNRQRSERGRSLQNEMGDREEK